MLGDMYAEVLVDVPVKNIEQVFHYALPDSMAGRIKTGSMVLVPFHGRKLTGFVSGFSPLPEHVDDAKIKEIIDIVDEGPVFTSCQMELARWLADFYLCPLASVLQAVIWPRIQGASPKKVKGVYPVIPPEGRPVFNSRAAKSMAVWHAAAAHPGMSKKNLAAMAGASVYVIDKMIAGGLLRCEEIQQRRDPYPKEQLTGRPALKHTVEQEAVIKEITKAINRSGREAFLLYGVSGGGKTEVYLRAIDHALAMGKQSVVMVPEISLTPQMVSVFKGYFGDRVAVLHSRLSDGERYDEWMRIACGAAPIVLGARSAVFAPVTNLGLIILDEEHEPSYKQEETPRYHARDVALWMAARFEAVAVFGSATPALESFFRAQSGGPYKLLSITERVGSRRLPEVQIIDMREEMKSGNAGIFSSQMISGISTNLSRGEQVILFLNRRGYSTFVVCRECGTVMKCPHCDISLTYHSGGSFRCHYCNHTVSARGYCPDCGSKYVSYFGTGTQKVEEEVQKLFPGAAVLRMDSDTTARKGSHGRILKAFREGKADILIGTQMVAKGLDIPGVTLVGVINADLTLHMPDFRSAERTFQLIEQVAGRAGRGDLAGKVLVQTFSPGHYSIIAAARHDYTGFYRREIKIRSRLGYPPFARLARVVVSGRDEEEVKELAEKWASFLKEMDKDGESAEILGPAAAPINKRNDRYRCHVFIKSKSGQLIRRLLRQAAASIDNKSKNDTGVIVDMDAQNMM